MKNATLITEHYFQMLSLENNFTSSYYGGPPKQNPGKYQTPHPIATKRCLSSERSVCSKE